MADHPEVEIRSRAELRAWLKVNHASTGSVWMVTWKKGSSFYVPFETLIEELLCWGWVDSVTRGVDADRSSVRISPRNPKSAWSAVNKALVDKARASGAMTDAGEALIAAAKENGQWTFLDDVERLEVPKDLDDALGTLREGWDAYPRSVKRGTLEWIKTAKQPKTRAARIQDVVSSLQLNQRPRPFRK